MRLITQFIWRKHALERMLERSITRNEVMECAYKGEIIESYPEDFPFPSFLVLYSDPMPLHIVMAMEGEDCYIITAYVPDLDIWNPDFRTKRLL